MTFPNHKFLNFLTVRGLMVAAGLMIVSFSVAAQRNGAAIENPTTVETRSPTRVVASVEAPSVMAAPTPTATETLEHTNATCEDLVGRPLSHLTDPNELKLNFGGIYDDVFDFRTYSSAEGSVILSGTIETVPADSIHVVTTGNNQISSFFSEKGITAVILKVGNDSYVFYYNIPGQGYTLSGGPLGPLVPDQRGTSHINFCFSSTVIPTAAPGSVTGRAVGGFGAGLRGVAVRLVDFTAGRSMSTATNSFGYYTFTDLEVGHFYMLSVSSKKYYFASPSKSFSLTADLADMDFVGVD
jgi:hypothetical protein